jgi:DNA-binding NarL/FixJ family response regulator
MDEATHIRLLSFDDRPLPRKGIAPMVSNKSAMQWVAAATNRKKGIHKFRQQKPDVTLMNVGLPYVSGIATIANRAEFAGARTVCLQHFQRRRRTSSRTRSGSARLSPKNISDKKTRLSVRWRRRFVAFMPATNLPAVKSLIKRESTRPSPRRRR